MSEHIKDLVVLQDQVGRPEITKGRESKRLKLYTDYWSGLKRNWKRRKVYIGESGNMNLHDGLKIIVNIDLSRDTTISPSQNTRNFPFRNNDDNARTTTTRTLASVPQNEGMSDSAKFLNLDSDIEISPEGDTNTSLPESLRLPITRDFETLELEDPKIVFNKLNSELGIPSTGRSIKEEKRESIAQITQSDLLEEANGQAMNDASNRINFLHPSTSSSALQASITLPFNITTEPFVENSVPPMDYSLPPPELEQSSLLSWPDTTSLPSVSTVLPPIVPVTPPVTTKVVPATVTPAVPHESEHVGPPLADTFGSSNVLANVLQAGATILPDTRDSEFPFPIPDEFNPKRTIEKTIKVGAEILARDTPLFRSFPNPLEPTRALKKGVEAGVEIISEATKDQNMFLNGSPNALRQLSKLGNVMLADTIISGPSKSKQVPSVVPEEEGKLDSQESNSELSHETLLLPVSLLDIPESVETVTELKDVVPQSTENMFDIEERFTDISVTTSCPQILPENNQSPSNEALSKIEVDEACPVRNEIDYGITDINIPVDKSYKSEDRNEEKDENNNSHNNTKFEVSSAGRKRSDQLLEQILYTDKGMIPTHFLDSDISLNLSQADSVIRNIFVGPPLIRNPKEVGSKLAETAETESPQKQLIPPIGVPLISLNLLNIVIVPPESKKINEMDPNVLSSKSSLTSPPPFEIPPMSLNFKASKPLTPSRGIPPPPIDLSQLLLNPFNANVPITDPVKTLNSGNETLSSTVPVTELNEASLPVRMHQLEEGVSKAESAKADKNYTKALLPTVSVISSSKIPPTTDINQLSPNPLKMVGMPPALNPLKGAAKIAESPTAVDVNAKQLSVVVSVIPPLTETPQLSRNLFEAERLMTQPADVLKSGDKTLPSVAPVIPPNEAPSPVSPNPHETLRPTVSPNEMLPSTEIQQQSLNLLESSLATAHLTASEASPNETASPVEMPYESLHPHDSDPAITESANTAEQLSTKAPNILQPVDVPQLSPNTFSADGAIVDPTKNLGSADGTLLSAASSIQLKGTASPADEASPPVASNTSPNETASSIEVPHESLHPQDSGPAIVGSPNNAVQLSTIAPSRLQPVDVPQSSLNTFSADGAIADPTKNLGSADGTLLSAGPSIQPKGTASPADEASSPIASNTSPNETASSIEVPHESLHPQDSGPAIVESPDNAEQLSTTAPSRLQPVDVPQSSLNTFSADGVIVDPTKNLGSVDKTLLSTVPSIQSKGTALPIDIPFSLLNPLEEGVAMDDPTKTLEPFGKALSFTVPVIPSNGTASSDGIPPLIHDPFGAGVGTAESEIGNLTGAKAVAPTMSLNDIPPPIYVPQLPLNLFNPGKAMAAPATPFESASQALPSSDILPNGTVSPIEIAPVSPYAEAIVSGDERISSTASDILPNGKSSLIETRSTPLHPHKSGLEASESAKSSTEGTEELSPTVSSPLPGITPPTEVPHLSLNTFGTDVVATDLLKDVASDDRTLSSAAPFIQSKETAISGDLPSLLLNPLEVGVTMANPTKALASFGEAVSFTLPVIPSNGTVTSDGIPPLIHDPFGAGVGKDETGKGIQTGAKALSPTSSSNIPPPFEAPQLKLNAIDAYIAMSSPTKPFESAGEALSSSVSEILPNKTVSSTKIPPVSPSEKAIGSGDEKISSAASDILPNGTVYLVKTPSKPLHTHEIGLEAYESAKSSEKDTKGLSPTVSSILPEILPPTHLSLHTFVTDDRTLSSTVPYIQPKETAIPGDLPFILLNPPEPGVTMADPTRALESFGEALSYSIPVTPSNGTASLDWIPPLMQNPFGAGVGKGESAKGIQTGAKAPSPTESSNNVPLLFKVPHLPLNSFDPGINMANPTLPFESASEAISSSVSDSLLTETVSPAEISPVSPTSNAIGSGDETESYKASVISQHGTVSPADIPAMSLPHESGLGIADSASEKDTEDLSHTPSSTSPGEIPPPDEVPHLPLSTSEADASVADPTSYLGSGDKTRFSTVPIIQPEETALPVGIQFDQVNTLESVGKAPSFSAPVKAPNGTVPPPLMLNLFGGAILSSESSNFVQIGAKASSIDIPKRSPNSFNADIPMDDLATPLEPSINAPTVSIRPSKRISSQVELPPTPLNPIDAGLETTESSKIAGKYTENLATTGPVTSLSEISAQSAKLAETNAVQLSDTGGIVSPIELPQLSQNPLEADVDPAKFPESDGEASTASENPSTIGAPQFSVNLFEVGLATVNPPKAREPGHKVLSSLVPLEPPTGIPNMSPAVSTNLTGVEPSKMSLGDGKVPLYHLEINSAAKTNADLLKQEVLSIPHSAAQRASVVFPFSPFNLDSEVTRSSSVPLSEASVPEHQDNASKLSTQIPLTIDLPIIPPNLSESVSSSTVAAVPEVRANVTEELSSSPLIPSSMPNIPWLTTPIPLKISSLPAEATTLKQSSVGIKLSEVSEVAEASVNQQQNNVKTASELSTQIPLTIDLPIILSSPSESVASSTFAVVPELHANVTEELSTKSPLIPSSMPNIPWLTMPLPLRISSLPGEATTLKQSSVGTNLSEVSGVAQASVTQQQNNVKAASELSTQIPLTTDLPIISSSPSESVASSRFAVVPEVHANITKELSSKSPVPLKVSSLPVEAATLKQSSIGIKLSEVPEIAEAGPKLTRSTFSKEPHISEELDDEIIEMESSDLASDWNRDMLGKAPIPSAASSIIEMDFGRKDPRSLYKIFNIMRDLSGKKLKNSGTSTNI
ncbi:unnamed protein product [Callosobruchus maculatus]|nr:unnamed protein product [Callosobruchus maculatus]